MYHDFEQFARSVKIIAASVVILSCPVARWVVVVDKVLQVW